MTIDEAIAKYKKITNTDTICPAYCNKSCDDCVEESEQLAEWLEELKVYQQHEIICNKGYNAGYKKAIDDYRTEICKAFVQSERNGNYRFYAVEIKQLIADLGEQLKERRYKL